MFNKSNRRKFQPRITFKNSLKVSSTPKSIVELASFKSLEILEIVTRTDPELTIFYFVKEDSSKGLSPIRNEIGEFLTVFFLKDS